MRIISFHLATIKSLLSLLLSLVHGFIEEEILRVAWLRFVTVVDLHIFQFLEHLKI
jgi:hypothetical protein